MRFKVPQDVQREDQILWFITLKQLICLLVGFFISYGMFSKLSETYHLGQVEMFLIWLPFLITVAFAFVKIKSIPLFKFILLLIEQLLFRASRRYWQENVGTKISMTYQTQKKETKKEEALPEKDFSASKAKNLAAMLDGEKQKIATLQQ